MLQLFYNKFSMKSFVRVCTYPHVKLTRFGCGYLAVKESKIFSLQGKFNISRLTFFNVNTLKSFKLLYWPGNATYAIADIELNDLVGIHITGIGHFCLYNNRPVSLH